MVGFADIYGGVLFGVRLARLSMDICAYFRLVFPCSYFGG